MKRLREAEEDVYGGGGGAAAVAVVMVVVVAAIEVCIENKIWRGDIWVVI